MYFNQILTVLLLLAFGVWIYRKFVAKKGNPVTKAGKSDFNPYSMDDQYNERKKSEQAELDQLLEKIARKGIQSLNKKEKERLKELSK